MCRSSRTGVRPQTISSVRRTLRGGRDRFDSLDRMRERRSAKAAACSCDAHALMLLRGAGASEAVLSELASLRFTDIGFGANIIKLTDETAKAVRSTGRQGRQLKSRRSRSFPIHADLRPVLEGIERHQDGR